MARALATIGHLLLPGDTKDCYSGLARIRPFLRLLEGLTMTKPMKTKTDLFAALEDDIKQFRDAPFGILPAAPNRSRWRSDVA